MKLLIETTGAFQLMDPNNGSVVRHEGYTVVEVTPFIQERLTGNLLTIAQLSDEATDKEWLAYLAESAGDVDLAVEAFKSEFGLKGSEGVKKSKAKKPKKAKDINEPQLDLDQDDEDDEDDQQADA